MKIRIGHKYRYLFIMLVLLYQGCATTGVNQQVADFQRPAEYIRFFEVLDRYVDDADVRNAAAFGKQVRKYI